MKVTKFIIGLMFAIFAYVFIGIQIGAITAADTYWAKISIVQKVKEIVGY